MNIVYDELIKLVDSFILKDLKEKNFTLKKESAITFLSHNRLDLAFKLLYLELKRKSPNLAIEIYYEHIRALTLGAFVEPGNNQKDSFEKYLTEFDSIAADIELNGFDNKKSIIALSKNDTIVNGSHRLASSIFFESSPTFVKTTNEDHIYDYKFFYDRQVPLSIIELSVKTFIKYSKNIHIAFLWPTAAGNDKMIPTLLNKIIYHKNLELTYNGAHNLITQIYSGEKWLGSQKDNFKGSKNKLSFCFNKDRPISVYVFQSKDINHTNKIKDEIRSLYGIGKHSIHITDTSEEAILISKIILNKNSLNFLDIGMPNKYSSNFKILDNIKEKYSFLNEDYIVKGDIIKSLYGIKQSSNYKIIKNNSSGEINIYNPKNFFFYNDIKFLVSEDNLNRELLESEFNQKVFYLLIKLKIKLIFLLKKINIYEEVHKVYKIFKKRKS